MHLIFHDPLHFLFHPEQVQLIVGKSADPKFLQKITYIALTHDPRILQVDTIRAYHSGESFFVEVDIVLPEEMTLKEAHDIGEDLQTKLETISNVDRCFVHLDYEFDHAPEHAPKKSIPKSTSQQTQLSSMAKN